MLQDLSVFIIICTFHVDTIIWMGAIVNITTNPCQKYSKCKNYQTIQNILISVYAINEVSPAKFTYIEDSYVSYESADGSSDVSAGLTRGIAPYNKQFKFVIIRNGYIWSIKSICSHYFNLPRLACFM